jgi:fluoroacetyl-CoA thioesterase
MKPGLDVGASLTKRYEIDKDRTIGFMGEYLRVYATPLMVKDVENACRDLLSNYLESTENTVGARVEIDHLGPTLIGMWVDVVVKLAGIEGRRINFDIEVRDELDTVGKAKHTRFVVDLSKQKERLEAKVLAVKKLRGE